MVGLNSTGVLADNRVAGGKFSSFISDVRREDMDNLPPSDNPMCLDIIESLFKV